MGEARRKRQLGAKPQAGYELPDADFFIAEAERQSFRGETFHCYDSGLHYDVSGIWGTIVGDEQVPFGPALIQLTTENTSAWRTTIEPDYAASLTDARLNFPGLLVYEGSEPILIDGRHRGVRRYDIGLRQLFCIRVNLEDIASRYTAPTLGDLVNKMLSHGSIPHVSNHKSLARSVLV